MPRPSFAMSPDTRLLRQRLQKEAVDEVVTYADLSAEISRPVEGGTPALQSAQKGLLRDLSMVFSPIRGVGLKRLNDHDIVKASDADLDSIRRKARRGFRKITAISDFSKLDPRSQLAHTTRASILGAVAEITNDRSIKKVEKVAAGRSSELPVRETLAAFK